MQGGNPETKTKVYNIVPLGPVSRDRKHVVGRFPLGPPGFKSGADWTISNELPKKEDGEVRKRPVQGPPPLLVHTQDPTTGLPRQLRGLPDTKSGVGSYFVLMKVGEDFTAIPVDMTYTLKPHHVRDASRSLEEAEAAMSGAVQTTTKKGVAVAAGYEFSLAPRSMKLQELEAAQRAVAEAKLREEAKAAFGDRADEIAALFGEGPDDTPAKGLVVHSDDEASDDVPDLFDEDDDKRRRGRGKKGGGGGGKDKKGAARATDDPEIPEDEIPEDVYKGEEDELRPAAPYEDAEWEHEEEVQDDDQDQGVDNEEYLDDPKIRKKLGLDEEEEDEEERARRQADEAEQERKRLEARIEKARKDAERVLDGQEVPEAEEDEEDEDEERRLEDAEDFDFEDLDALADFKEKKRQKMFNAVGGAAAGPGARDRSPAPGAAAAGERASSLGAIAAAGAAAAAAGGGRRRTPPPGAAAAARGTPPPNRGRTPPPGGTGGPGMKRSATPPGVAVAAAVAAGGMGLLRGRTPPLEGGMGGKRRPEDASGISGAAGDPAATKRSRLSPAPAMAATAAAVGGGGGAYPAPGAAAAAGAFPGVPTEEEIRAALRGGPMAAKALVNIFKPRLITAAEKLEFKDRMMRVGTLDNTTGVIRLKEL